MKDARPIEAPAAAAPSGATGGPQTGLARFAWLPISLLLAAIIAARAAGLTELYEHKDLRLFLSTIFYTLVSVATLYLFARSFLASGAPSLLLLECGVIFWSLAGTVGDAVFHGDKNINVTIFNTIILLAGLCLLAGAALTLWPRPAIRAKALWLAAGCAVSVGLVVLIAWAALAGWFPVFLVPGEGGTPVRYGVLIAAIMAMVLSAGLLRFRQRGAAQAFTSWYVPALLSLAVGLFGIMIQLDMDTLVNWLSRTAQWLGGFYLLVAALASVRETGAWVLSLDAAAWDRRMALFDERLLGFLAPRRLRSLSALWRYGLAIAFAALAVAVRWAAIPVMGTDVPHTISIPMVVVSTVLLGLGPGFVSILLAIVGDEVFILGTPMRGIEGIALARLCGTLIAGAFLCTIVHAIRAAATKVRQSEERYRALAELSPDAIFVHAGGKIIYANAATARLFGAASAADLVGQAMLDRIHPEDRPVIADRIAQAYDGQVPPLRESRFLRFDGSMIWVEASGARIRFDGQPAIQAVARDVTERKRAEEALRLTQASIDVAAEMVAWFTPDGRVRYVNDATCRTLGYTRNELLGMTALDFSPGFTWEQYAEHWREVRERKSFTLEVTHRRKDGSQYPAEVLVNHFVYGGQEFIFASGRDITARKRAEEALSENRAKLQAAVSSMTDAFFVADADGRLTEFNDGFVTYHRFKNREECSQCIADCPRYLDVWHEDGTPAPPETWAMARALRGETASNVEYKLRRKDTGETWWGSYSFGPIRDSSGRITGGVVVGREVTDRKAAQEAVRRTVAELERSNKELEQFAYVSSHDLQEPLRQVRAFVQLLRERHQDRLDGQAGQYLQFVYEGASRMSDLVQGLLDYSRVGARELRRRPTPARQALDAALANLQTAVAESQARITCDELPTVTVEPTQLTQLFQNLISNAIKFGRDGVPPEIQVGARREAGRWLFWVRDNGIGIEPQYREKVFLIFQRLHDRSKYAGTGIGLAICRKIVEQHGGKMWIESKAGEGSTFYFTLPEDHAT